MVEDLSPPPIVGRSPSRCCFQALSTEFRLFFSTLLPLSSQLTEKAGLPSICSLFRLSALLDLAHVSTIFLRLRKPQWRN